MACIRVGQSRYPGRLPIGYTVVEPSSFSYDFLVLIVVGEQHRQAGIGQLLVSDTESTERDTKLFTSTNLSNQGMQRLPARRGGVSALDEGAIRKRKCGMI